MPQVPYYGAHYRFTEPPPPEPEQPALLGLDPLSWLVVGAVAWWGWRKGWWLKGLKSKAPGNGGGAPERAA